MVPLDNGLRRPVTPPFAQLVKMSHSNSININNPSSTTNTNTNKEDSNRKEPISADMLRDKLENIELRMTPG